ncbi:hypothetical protein [Streptococcus thoraltensis]|uniref:hypothetical protein n=1 Tax=Streptococcus thoraltensis TaxID=55085 RepID=UPI002A83B11E|nr:hypothetical protein [Streptococcus thoraltensis]MDY4761189.1 hypothetical protein [Streptococcus thoraltensis]
MRKLSRQRKYLVEDRTKEVNRIHKILQFVVIKLTTYIEDIKGSSDRNLMRLLCDKSAIDAGIVRQAVILV